jgi:hypothetical protein
MGLCDFKNLNEADAVTSAQAGVRNYLKSLDTGLRRYDE